jgi:uncharacterized membrane protein
VGLDLSHQFLQAPPAADMAVEEYVRHLAERVLMFGIPIGSLGAGGWLLSRTPRDENAVVTRANDTPDFVQPNWALQGAIAFVVALLALYLNLEIHRTVGYAYAPLRWPLLTVVWLAFSGWLLWQALRFESQTFLSVLLLVLVAIVAKLFAIDAREWHLSPEFLYEGAYSFRDGLMRLIDFGAIMGFFAAVYWLLTARKDKTDARTVFAASGLGLLFAYLTLELNSFMHTYLDGMRYGAISILWTVFALAFLVRGIHRRIATLRYAGLVLFVAVVFKVFFVDLARLDSFYRIIAFLVLGVMVLAGSFIYFRDREAFAITPSGDDSNPDAPQGS